MLVQSLLKISECGTRSAILKEVRIPRSAALSQVRKSVPLFRSSVTWLRDGSHKIWKVLGSYLVRFHPAGGSILGDAQATQTTPGIGMASPGGSEVPPTSLDEVRRIQPVLEQQAEVIHGIDVACLGGS